MSSKIIAYKGVEDDLNPCAVFHSVDATQRSSRSCRCPHCGSYAGGDETDGSLIARSGVFTRIKKRGSDKKRDSSYVAARHWELGRLLINLGGRGPGAGGRGPGAGGI
jgi:hypothetical protein